MVEAARKHKRVVQVGIQRLSSPLLQGGGRVDPRRRHRQGDGGRGRFHVQNEWPKGIGNPPDEDPPKGFDWDAWLGPAPMRQYNKNRTFYRFRWFYDYSGGQLTNFGVHYLADPLGARASTRRWPSPRWAASSPTTTTARCPTRWRCCGTTPATRW